MKLVFRYKTEILILSLLILLYFALRLPNLTLQPIFADEAIYIRWAQVMKAEPTLRFISLSDGKTPLFMWMMIPLFKLISDPLMAGRLLSVFSGVTTLLGLFFLGRLVFNKTAGLWAALIYTITPYTVFFDRMALVDSMLTAFSVWSLNFAILLLKQARLDYAMILGYLLGGGLLTKTPAMVNLFLLPITLVGFRFRKTHSSIFKLILYWLVALVIALTAYNILRLGPGFQQLSARNADYVFAPKELVGRPLDPFIPHFRDLSNWFPKLITWPTLLFIAAGIIFVSKKMHRLGIVVVLWGLLPILAEMAFLRTFTARYLLPSIAPFLVIGSFGIASLSEKIKLSAPFKAALFLLVLLPLPLWFDYLLLTDPQKAPLPREERIGYLEDWTAGYGFPQIAKYLIDKSKEGSVVVGTEGFFGTLPDGLQIYLDKTNIAVIGGPSTISAQIRQAVRDNQTFYVVNKNRTVGTFDNVQLLLEFPKAKPSDNEPTDAIQLYRVLPAK